MWNKKVPFTKLEEIQQLFLKYASGKTTLSAISLLSFLHKEQMELTANEGMAESLIDRYEIEETARDNRFMTFKGFLRYIESEQCCAFNQDHTNVYQDMDQPLTSYFISSSHNTYLTGDQLVGKSSLDAYICALRKGCRCLEIDCWDGQNMEPVVYHGYTLTTKLRFKDVISTVEQHAFEASAYPVILSLENHCSQQQQEVMAQHLISILGEKLLREPLKIPTTAALPSPNDLKYKILIKNKQRLPQDESEDAAGVEVEESADESEDEEVHQRKAGTKKTKKKKKKMMKKKEVAVAEILSNLAIYTKSVNFISFSYSKDNQNYNEMTSMEENKAHKLVKVSGVDFVKHNQMFLTRVYPGRTRIFSSNYNPQEFWNVGLQLVAVNFQSLGLPMDLYDGRFQDNGGCGYVLKPDVLMSSQRGFDLGCIQRRLKRTHLMLRVISGSNVPSCKTAKALQLFVTVHIHGIPSDCYSKNTPSVKNTSLSPYWGAVMNFQISIPELCLVQFCVREQTSLFSSELVCQYTLPFMSLKKGYRWLPLRSQDGCSLDTASLFIFVSYS